MSLMQLTNRLLYFIKCNISILLRLQGKRLRILILFALTDCIPQGIEYKKWSEKLGPMMKAILE